ncbi:MAG TPA: PAS domain-containing protein, partial [Solirubrobacter sp.]
MTGVLLSSLPDVALLPDAALLLDPGGRVLSANPPAAAMFAVEPVGRELTALIPDARRLWDAVAAKATGLIPLEGRRANGVPFALDASVGRQADGSVVCLLRELDRQAPGTLDAAFDAMPIGMALFNTDGEYVRVNAALCALLARTAGELVG